MSQGLDEQPYLFLGNPPYRPYRWGAEVQQSSLLWRSYHQKLRPATGMHSLRQHMQNPNHLCACMNQHTHIHRYMCIYVIYIIIYIYTYSLPLAGYIVHLKNWWKHAPHHLLQVPLFHLVLTWLFKCIGCLSSNISTYPHPERFGKLSGFSDYKPFESKGSYVSRCVMNTSPGSVMSLDFTEGMACKLTGDI